MNQENNDWETLQSEWQTFQPDMKKIRRKVNWVTWRMVFILALEVLLVLGYFGFLYYSANYKENSLSIDIWNYFIGIGAIIGLYLDFKLRLPIFKLESDSTKDILNLYLKRTLVGVALGRWAKLFSWILLIAFNLWVTANAIYLPEESRLSSLQFILFGNFWISGCLMGCFWYQRKKQKEYLRLKTLWQDYVD